MIGDHNVIIYSSYYPLKESQITMTLCSYLRSSTLTHLNTSKVKSSLTDAETQPCFYAILIMTSHNLQLCMHACQ